MTREIDANVESAALIVNSVISLLRIDRDAVLAEAAEIVAGLRRDRLDA